MGPLRFSRNMVVIQRESGLVLVNSVRLNPAGLAVLDALGPVTDVVRLAGGHGCDDPFYAARYKATVWAMAGQRYFEGVRPDKGATYFHADRLVDSGLLPVLPKARLFHFGTTPPEAALLLPHAGGTLIAGDALQNWGDPDGHFNPLGRAAFQLMGFVGPHRLGKGWLKHCNPAPERLHALLEWPFENVLPAHGDPVIGAARARYRDAVDAYTKA